MDWTAPSRRVHAATQTSISRATIGRRLAENALNPWPEKMWGVPRIDATHVARMGDVLGLDSTIPRPGTAVVCIDETPQRRTAVDFAKWLRDLVDLHCAGTERLLIVLDNLSTHTPAALYEAFPPA